MKSPINSSPCEKWKSASDSQEKFGLEIFHEFQMGPEGGMGRRVGRRMEPWDGKEEEQCLDGAGNRNSLSTVAINRPL